MAGEMRDQSKCVQASSALRMSRLKSAKRRFSAKSVAVDVREGGEGFVEILLALFWRRVQHVEEACEVQAKVGAVGGGAVQQIESLKDSALEDSRVLGEEAKENANEKAFELMPGVAASLQRVVEVAHDVDGLNVDRVLVLELVLFVAGDEGKEMNVFVQFGERKFDADDAAGIEEREYALVFWLKIVQGDAGEVGDDDVAGNFIHAPFAREVLNVAERLRLGFAEVSAQALVLDEHLCRARRDRCSRTRRRSSSPVLQSSRRRGGGCQRHRKTRSRRFASRLVRSWRPSIPLKRRWRDGGFRSKRAAWVDNNKGVPLIRVLDGAPVLFAALDALYPTKNIAIC